MQLEQSHFYVLKDFIKDVTEVVLLNKQRNHTPTGK